MDRDLINWFNALLVGERESLLAELMAGIAGREPSIPELRGLHEQLERVYGDGEPVTLTDEQLKITYSRAAIDRAIAEVWGT